MSKPTKEQQQIIDAEFSNILIINAYAGCGKTSTLVNFCAARATSKILYLAYNSSMAREARTKFKALPNVECKTMHALAYAVFGTDKSDRLEAGSINAYHLLQNEVINSKGALDLKAASVLLKFLRFYANSDATSCKNAISLFLEQEDCASDEKLLKKYAQVCWNEIHRAADMPYEHDFYLKAYQLSKPKLSYDYILVDEAQDINDCVLSVVLPQKCRKVFIGDRFQSIYGFRGANGAMQRLSARSDALTLSLSQSFRCSPHIAELANVFLTAAGAKERFSGLNTTQNEAKQRVVISRTNAGVLQAALADRSAKLYFVGGIKSYNFNDIKQVMFLLMSAKKPEAKNLITHPFLAKFDDFEAFKQYLNESKDVEWKAKFNIMLRFLSENIFECLRSVSERAVKRRENADLILTTAHKSKGLEWEECELNSDFPNFLAAMRENKDPVIPVEELHLLYVAITRAKSSLTIDEEYLPQSDSEINDFIAYAHEHLE